MDPIEELMRVLAETLDANALRLTTTRGGYVGGGRPHATLDSDPGALEAIARGLLARKVAEPSRVLAATPTEQPRDDGGLRAAAEAIDSVMQASLSTEGIAEAAANKSWANGKMWVPAELLADLPLPCPMRSSLTAAPCVLTWGHEPDSPRFHRFRAALTDGAPDS